MMIRKSISLIRASIAFAIAPSILCILSIGGLPKANSQEINSDLNSIYESAIEDSSDFQQHELVTNLTSIDEYNPDLQWEGEHNNSRLLVATLTNKIYPKGKFNPPNSGTWVTAVPDLFKFCSQYSKTILSHEQLILRLKQLLGLPPQSPYTHVALIWVDKRSLKRPSLDPEINDKTTLPIPNQISNDNSLLFSQDVDEAYRKWFVEQLKQRARNKNREDNLRRLSNSTLDDVPYPWTGLGYTYDWEPKTNLQTHVGLSEFVLFPSSESINSPDVKEVVSIESYCKSN